MLQTYKKGARAERELIGHFDQRGFSVIRAAGSGGNSLSPDILIFKHGMQYAIESKAHEKEHLHLDKDQFLTMRKWEENTGITSLIGWKRNRKPWSFLRLSLFEENEKSFAISWKTAESMGMRLDEF
ncbi:MAG: Holliday junction resolvase Hjc [Candidatus Micrarchaeota archaeon]